MTAQVMDLARDVCGGRLVIVHEGGYSETYVPFCGHSVLQRMSGSTVDAPDPFAEVFPLRQPDARFDAYLESVIDDMFARLHD
jgi:acetoin utilization deacetylase AcuC-like enzyme